MNIFGVGIPEIAVIFVLALLIFGPKKLPELGRFILWLESLFQLKKLTKK